MRCFYFVVFCIVFTRCLYEILVSLFVTYLSIYFCSPILSQHTVKKFPKSTEESKSANWFRRAEEKKEAVTRLRVLGAHTSAEHLQEAYVNCDVHQAKATIDSDRKRIIAEMASLEGSLAAMNVHIKSGVFESVQRDAILSVQRFVDSHTSVFNCQKLALMLQFKGDYRASNRYFSIALQMLFRIHAQTLNLSSRQSNNVNFEPRFAICLFLCCF